MSAKNDSSVPDRVEVGKRKRGAADPGGGNVGNALRSVYDQTVGEEIPSDLLDLLGKLT